MNAKVVELNPPRRADGPPLSVVSRTRLANPGVSFEAWTEANADRIWRLLRDSDQRNVSFWECALMLWETL